MPKTTTLFTVYTMAGGGASTRGPKPWKLTEEESFSSFTHWKHNILYSIAQEPTFEPTFKPFLESGATWERLTSDNPSRGLIYMQLVTTASRDQQLVPTTHTLTFHKNKHYFCLNIKYLSIQE